LFHALINCAQERCRNKAMSTWIGLDWIGLFVKTYLSLDIKLTSVCLCVLRGRFDLCPYMLGIFAGKCREYWKWNEIL